MGGPVIENWQSSPNDCQDLTRKIVNESREIVNVIIENTLDIASSENRFVPDDFKDRVNETFNGLIAGITRRLMRKYEKPLRIITEVTISNVNNHHEGRIDALLEYHNGYGL